MDIVDGDYGNKIGFIQRPSWNIVNNRDRGLILIKEPGSTTVSWSDIKTNVSPEMTPIKTNVSLEMTPIKTNVSEWNNIDTN